MSLPKQAVCIIIPTIFQNIVAVSRKNSTTSFGLPGGKVDEGENIIDAVVRETFEEIGLDISGLTDNLYAIYSSIVFGKTDGKNYWVTTFCLVPNKEIEIFANEYLSNLKPEEGLIIKNMSLLELGLKGNSSFFEYNLEVFGAYGRFKASSLAAFG